MLSSSNPSSSPCFSFRTINVETFRFLFMDLMIIVAILGLLSFWATSHAISCNQLDHDSLLSFSNNITSQSSRLDWNVSVDCCSWEGVSCDIRTGRVISLKLPSRELVGSISRSIATLNHLRELNLRGNSLTGTFPDGLFVSLNQLQVIDLSHNRLSGQLPATDMIPATTESLDFSSNELEGTIPLDFLEQAKNLVSFNVSNNFFEGLIPGFICGISSSVRVLDFSYNGFNGNIPQGFQNCTKLETLRAGFNLLSGPLPHDIYKLSTLQELSFPANKLNGSLTDKIAYLKNLKILALYGNELEGIIPPGIGKISTLKQLLLHRNTFNGILPPNLTNCTKLTVMMLRENFLSGELSHLNFSKFTQLRVIDLGDNLFNGILPANLFVCKSLIAIRLAANQLTGEIPPNIPELKSLSYLSVSNNSLTNISSAIKILSSCRALTALLLGKNFYNESLPGDDSSIDSQGFQNLQFLAIGSSNLNGRIPSWLAKLRKLKVLDLAFNDLTGSIPSFLGSLPDLFFVALSLNRLSGEFPVELTAMPRLRSQQAANQPLLELPVFLRPDNASNHRNQLTSIPPAIFLKSNNLSGNIPMEIGRLKFLHVLDLSDNSFSGSIPNSISQLKNLEKLDLSGNHLSGEIPASLGFLHFLSFFNVSENNLQGPIPGGGQFDTFTADSFKGNPGLCGKNLQRPCRDDKPATSENHSASSKILNHEIIFRAYLGICFGIGFTISTLALRRYQIRGSFLEKILIRTMKMHFCPF